jgi:transposase
VPVLEIARRLEVSRMSVRRWCDRYMEQGFQGLSDLPRPGRPRSLSLRSSASA